MPSRFRLYLLSGLLILPGIGRTAEPDTIASPDHLEIITAQIEEARALKDSTFRHDPNSPIPAHRRADFEGLSYFPVDLNYRLIGDLHVYGRRRQIQVSTSDSTAVSMERFGRFVARLEGKPFWLEVYRSYEDDRLLVFFTDETNGQETYSGGRYASLINAEKNRYLIDFNNAYNPYCAYNPAYVCPLPPAQNRLSVPIRAGEKADGADLAH